MDDYWHILKKTALRWWEDKVPRLGAALAFYSVLSIGPLLLIVTAIAGLVFGREAVSGQLARQIEGLVGKQAAETLQLAVANSYQPDTGIVAAVIGIATLLFAASGVFAQLQDALNTIWGIQAKSRPFFHILKDRFLSFTMVLGTGFLLLTSLTISAGLSGLGDYFFGQSSSMTTLLEALNFAVSFTIITFLFALIFKVLPDAHIQWRDVWLGAALTAALFTIGKFLIGIYLGRSALSSTYGAAGSLVIVLIWVYYSSQILFFGAEFTQVCAERHQQIIPPTKNARPVTPQERRRQGQPVKDSSGIVPWLVLGMSLLSIVRYSRDISSGIRLARRFMR
ncbi:MAG: YihY/virulence factor BrkB family protein [Rickettsiales bacterium]